MGYGGVGQGSSIGKQMWLYPTIEKTLRMAGLTEKDTVAIYADTNRNMNIFEVFFAAANNINPNVFAVIGNPGFGGHGEKGREPSRPIIEMLKKCDFIIDMPTNHWCYTDAYNEVLDAGAKILLTSEDEELLYRLAPREDIIELTRRAAKILTDCKEFRIKSDAGTDLVMSLEGRVCNAQSGITSEEYRWDNYPSGITEVAPVEDSLNGTMVIAPGDPIVELERRVSEKIVCTFKNGSIVDIQGGLEAKYLSDWLDQWNDPNVRTVAHTGFGTDPRATVFSTEAMDWESLEGGINVALGANFARFLNGKNRARAHMDIILLNASCWADDVQLVDHGKILIK